MLDVAHSEGLNCDLLVPLRSTNNTVFLLAECAVVAKVHDSEAAAVRELAAGHALPAVGALTVAPAAGIGDQVRSAAGLHVTFWDYVADADTRPSSVAVAVALCDLHRHLVGLRELVAGRGFEEQLEDARRALQRSGFAPLLGPADRELLRDLLGRAAEELRNCPRVVVHGSPHRMNILVSDGGVPVFTDLETIQLGPIEWDLAHLEVEVARAYPGSFDDDLLALCRTAVSATTATWCWDALDRGSDMRTHAEHHLAVVCAASAR